MGTMEGDKDLWLSGAEIFLLGTICLSFSLSIRDNHEEKDKGTYGWGCEEFPLRKLRKFHAVHLVSFAFFTHMLVYKTSHT